MRRPINKTRTGWIAAIVLLMVTTAWAGEADVVEARAVATDNATWLFLVAVKHADTGWDHYANKWEVLSGDGAVLAERVLRHPHVNEQPFERSLSGVKLPAGTMEVIIRAHDSVHGYGGKTVRLTLKR